DCFFQAEDGIRDGHMTGVQTCALPILNAVAVVLVVFRCVDAALSGDAVGAARAVLEAKTLHVIAQFSQGRAGRSARESGADDDKIGRASCRERVEIRGVYVS